MPVVSVIIPTYNRAGLLPRALRSALQQTMTDLEVIVLDDGSTDQTREVVVEFADPRIRHFSRPHRGVAAARNEALLYARASLIAFLDSDDEWVPDKLDRQLRHLAGTAQSAGIVYSGFTSVHEDTGRRYVYAPPASGRGMVFAKLLETHWITFSTVVARREVFEAVGGFNEGLRTGSDREWLLRVARRYAFDFLPDSLALYYQHPATSMQRDLRGRITLIKTILDEFSHDLRRRPALHAQKYVNLADLHLRLQERAQARRALRRAIAIAPSSLRTYVHVVLTFGGWDLWLRFRSRWRRRYRLDRPHRKGNGAG